MNFALSLALFFNTQASSAFQLTSNAVSTKSEKFLNILGGIDDWFQLYY